MSEKKVLVTEKPNSVEVKRSGKGEISWSIKAYGVTLNEAMEEANVTQKKLIETYINPPKKEDDDDDLLDDID